jgi:23S rRNA pseudouridine1911/1915/1917 synthase
MKSNIIYEDQVMLVIHKPAGFATQTKQLGLLDVESELKNHLASTTKNPYLAVIHRLDQPVEGLLVFAKTKEAAAFLSSQLQQQLLHKSYQALLFSTNLDTIESIGIFEDFLSKDDKGNHSRVVDSTSKDAKKCSLRYEIMESREQIMLAQIDIQTGRHHQIRVQMSHHKLPIMGDQKYGSEESIKLSVEKQIRQVACVLHLWK